MLSPEDLAALPDALPAFSPGAKNETGELTRRYLQAYGLDFTGDFPGLGHHLGRLESGPYRLAVHHWHRAGSRRLMLLVHGYFDHTGLYGHLVKFALSLGYDVLAFDLPGHGLSTGERAVIDDFAEYRAAIEAVLQQAPFPAHCCDVMAQSTGAAAVMDLLQHGGGGQPGRVVLLAPLVRPRGWRRVRLAHTLLRLFADGIARRFAENSGDEEFLRFLREDPLQPQRVSTRWVTALRRWIPGFLAAEPCSHPVLVIQGDQDGTVDWEYNLPEIRRLFPAAEVYMLAGARHHLANETAELRSNYLGRVQAWLESDLPDGPGVEAVNATLHQEG